MAELFALPARATDSNGNPLSGAKLYFYATGTTTPQAVYTTSALSTPHSNPVVADSAGKFASVYLDPSRIYRCVLKSADNAQTIHDIDPVNSDEIVSVLLKYVRSTDYEVQLGYDDVSGTAAAVKIGGLNAFSGAEGILQLGGAGPKDGSNGLYLGCLGHANWPAMQPATARNPIELALYANGTTGLGNSSGTTTFVASSGTFTSTDVGRAIWIDGSAYTINSRTNATTVVLSSAPASGVKVWHIVVTTGAGTCSVSGGVVTRTSGDPFIPHTFGTGFSFKLNGTAYTVTTSTSGDSCTISSPPANGVYSYAFETNINDQIAAFRLGPQFSGLDEENLSILARTTRYEVRTLYAGSGGYRDLVIGSGEYSAGNLSEQVSCKSDGNLVLMGVGNKIVRIGGAVAHDRLVNVSANAGYFAGVRLETASSARWDLSKGSGAEGGGNAGSDFVVNSFSDAGGFIETPLQITRSTGLTTLKNLNLLTGGSVTVNGVKVIGARDTGWTAMTGSSDKATAYATGSVTLPQLAGRVMAIQAALTTHGLLGA